MKRLRMGGLVLVLSLGLASCGEPTVSDFNRQGNDYFAQGIYGQALQQYKEAVLIAPDRPEPSINLGIARYQLGDYLGAIEAPNSVLESAPPELQSTIYYNQGNAHFRLGEYEDAIDGYKNALRRTPNDADAKYNLELAQKLLEQQQQQQQQAGGGQGQQQQPQDGQQPDQQQGGGDQQPDQQNPQGGGDQQPDQQRPNPPPSSLSPDQAERALDRLRRSEENQNDELYDNYAVGGNPDEQNSQSNSGDSEW